MATPSAPPPTNTSATQNPHAPPEKRHRSIFELPADFFDSCRLLRSPAAALPIAQHLERSLSVATSDDVVDGDLEIIGSSSKSRSSTGNVNSMQKWSCSTCKAEFDSLQDQRFHFKSDIHRLNIKLAIAGRDTVKEEDFDEMTSDSLCKDNDVSSISGSEDEDEKEYGLNSDIIPRGNFRSKIYVQLQSGEIVSVWKCLILDESESIAFEDAKSVASTSGLPYLTEKQVNEKLKYTINESRDNSHLRIVLLARGGHFAGCVFDGNSVVAHKTFHRYVVRGKAGKKQSSKDASGKVAHSAGSSIRRHNELALKKEIQELLSTWKPYFAASSSVFIYAPSNNRQLLFDGEKPYSICQHHAVRNIPLTVRRPTFKEAHRIYNLLTQVSSEVEEVSTNVKADAMSNTVILGNGFSKSRKGDLKETTTSTDPGACNDLETVDNAHTSSQSEAESDLVGTSTPLHEAAKSGNPEHLMELLEQGLDPCVKDERGRTPYMLAMEKEVRNVFRRFMASNLDKWDWNAAKVPSALTKEMEDFQAAKQAEKDAKRKARAKELKKLRKARQKKAQAEDAQSEHTTISGSSRGTSVSISKGLPQSSGVARMTKEEELKRAQDAEREKRAAAAERRIGAAAALRAQDTGSSAAPSDSHTKGAAAADILCSCCHVSLAGKIPFHRYNYKYCSTSCMHVHREILEDE